MKSTATTDRYQRAACSRWLPLLAISMLAIAAPACAKAGDTLPNARIDEQVSAPPPPTPSPTITSADMQQDPAQQIAGSILQEQFRHHEMRLVHCVSLVIAGRFVPQLATATEQSPELNEFVAGRMDALWRSRQALAWTVARTQYARTLRQNLGQNDLNAVLLFLQSPTGSRLLGAMGEQVENGPSSDDVPTRPEQCVRRDVVADGMRRFEASMTGEDRRAFSQFRRGSSNALSLALRLAAEANTTNFRSQGDAISHSMASTMQAAVRDFRLHRQQPSAR